MALRYGSKSGSALRYNPYSALALRYGSKIAWNGEEVYIPTDSKYFTFTKFNNQYIITGVDVENIPAEVVLPSTYEGLPVTMCGADFGEKITSLVITSPVVLGNCFNNSTNLANITFTTDGVHLGSSTFLNTAYYNDESNWVDDILYIGKHLIVAKETISDVNIRSGTVNIAEGAFGDCTNISHITIPDGVRTVQGGFNENLEAIIIPDSVTTINDNAFYGCKNITIYCEASSKPSGWTNNWDYSSSNLTVVWGLLDDKQLTFTEQADGTYSVKAKDVTTLPSVVVIPWEYNGKAVTAIDVNAFRAATITKAVITEGITTIGYGAFENCTNLVSVSIPNTVTTFGAMNMGDYTVSSTFSGCSSLNEITLPSGITEIGGDMFRNCTSLKDFVIPDTVTTIGAYAFYYNRFDSVVIPLSVTTMGTKAFGTDAYNENLTIYCWAESRPSGWASDWNKAYSGYSTVVWNSKVISNGYFTFTNVSDGTYSVKAKDVNNLPSVVIIPASYNGKAVTGIGYAAFRDATITEVHIPDSVTYISKYAFCDCTGLTNITIPDSVTSIGERAFDSCSSLTSVVIGDSVTSIGEHAFAFCDRLTSVIIGDGVTSIGESAFYHCDNLTNIVIPDSVTTIGVRAFAYCDSLTSIIIGNSVTSIGNNAFDGCSSLTINCKATEQPSGWDANWNCDNRPVVWGYTG